MAPDERPISDWLLAAFCPVFQGLSSLAAFLLLCALQALPVIVKKGNLLRNTGNLSMHGWLS
jgi:hypothetical protein